MNALWTLNTNPGLDERGDPLRGTAPITYQNASSLTEGLLAQRPGFQGFIFGDFTAPIMWIGEFLTNTGAYELWVAGDDSGTAKLMRCSGGTWSTVAFSDTPVVADLIYMHGLSMNGKFFLAYHSDVNRLHVWDGTSIRRVGLIAATAPTVATDGGAGLTFTRFYRQRNTVQVAGVTTRRSEPSTAVTIAIVDDAGVTVTKGAVSGDGETHWEVEASVAADGPWYRIATLVVGTLTYDDTSAAISTTDPSDEAGLFIPPPSAKYLSTDGLSLTLGAAWETTAAAGETIPKQNRAWFTPPLGALDVGDDERIPDTSIQHNWIDVGDAGPITGLQGPIYNDTIVFKNTFVNKLTPTGNVESPYALSVISAAQGAVDQRLTASGELGGVPAILFADRNALYALTAGGITTLSEPIGRSMRTTTIGADTGLLLFDAFQRVAFLQTSLASGSQDGTYTKYTLDVVKKRWAGFDFAQGADGWVLGTSLLGIDTVLGGTDSEILNGVLATTSEGQRRIHLCGQFGMFGGATPAIFTWGLQCAADGNVPPFPGTENVNSFTTSARFRKMLQPGLKATFGAPTIWYRNPQGTATTQMNLTVAYQRDFDQTTSQSVVLDPTDVNNGIAVVQHTLEGLSAADVSVLDVIVTLLKGGGTAFASEVTPTIDAISIPYTVQEPLAQ